MTESERMTDHRKLHRRRNDRFEQYVSDEMASLRAALDIQFKRIAQIQAELDLSKEAIDRRSSALDPLLPLRLPNRGNGRNHS